MEPVVGNGGLPVSKNNFLVSVTGTQGSWSGPGPCSIYMLFIQCGCWGSCDPWKVLVSDYSKFTSTPSPHFSLHQTIH